MKLNPEALEVVSFETAGAPQAASTSTIWPKTTDPTEATFCEIC